MLDAAQKPRRPRIIGANFDFSDAAWGVLTAARHSAANSGRGAITTEHVLLAVLRADAAVLRRLMEKLGIDQAEVARALEELIPTTRRPNDPEELRFSTGAKAALGAAVKSATKFRAAELDPEHLLLGVITAGRGAVAVFLRQHGLHLREVSRELDRLRKEGASPEFGFQIDDASDQTIYQQIVQQVKEAVATAHLGPGDRLPTVRQVAESLDIAPGTVARAYRELEQEGIVATDRARGTRIADRSASGKADAAEPGYLVPLLRPVAVGAYHLGITADQLRRALDEAMRGVFHEDGATS